MCEIAVNSLLPIGFPIQVSDLEVYLPRANFTSARAGRGEAPYVDWL